MKPFGYNDLFALAFCKGFLFVVFVMLDKKRKNLRFDGYMIPL